jgi:hypothetical protein
MQVGWMPWPRRWCAILRQDDALTCETPSHITLLAMHAEEVECPISPASHVEVEGRHYLTHRMRLLACPSVLNYATAKMVVSGARVRSADSLRCSTRSASRVMGYNRTCLKMAFGTVFACLGRSHRRIVILDRHSAKNSSLLRCRLPKWQSVRRAITGDVQPPPRGGRVPCARPLIFEKLVESIRAPLWCRRPAGRRSRDRHTIL